MNTRGKFALSALTLWALLTFGPDLLRPWIPLATFPIQLTSDGEITHVDGAYAREFGCLKEGDTVQMKPSFRIDRNLLTLFSNSDSQLNYVLANHPLLILDVTRDGRPYRCEIRPQRLNTPWPVHAVVMLQDIFGGLFIIVCLRIVLQHPRPATWGLFVYSIWFSPALNFVTYAALQPWPFLVLTEETLQAGIQSAGYVGLIVFAVHFPTCPSRNAGIPRIELRWCACLPCFSCCS